MALADLQNKEPTPPRRPGPVCSVCNTLASLPAEEADAFRALLADTRWRYTELSEALKQDPDYPIEIEPSMLSWHARGRCAAKERLR